MLIATAQILGNGPPIAVVERPVRTLDQSFTKRLQCVPGIADDLFGVLHGVLRSELVGKILCVPRYGVGQTNAGGRRDGIVLRRVDALDLQFGAQGIRCFHRLQDGKQILWCGAEGVECLHQILQFRARHHAELATFLLDLHIGLFCHNCSAATEGARLTHDWRGIDGDRKIAVRDGTRL